MAFFRNLQDMPTTQQEFEVPSNFDFDSAANQEFDDDKSYAGLWLEGQNPMEIEYHELEMIDVSFQPPIPPIVYSQPETVGDKLDVASSFTRDAALDSDAYNTAALHQWPFQPAHETFNQWSLINGCSINTSSQAQWNDQIPQSVPAYEIEHVPSASKIAQSPFRPLRPKPTQQQTQVPRLAASKKPLHCTKCSKTYNSPGGLRRHDVKGHDAERRTGGRPSTSSRRLS